ncbi:MAG: helicase HerA domain-containing protein [Myxococcota bacterium]
MSADDYEKLGRFYLGRRYDAAADARTEEPILYDAKDLTTHAVCVGMTGSGKTGLAIGLLEEAAIDGVPIIAIDPKGDLPNLLLTFPELRPADFAPWVDASDAARRGRSVEEEARATADLWRQGLADWGQSPSRIERFEQACERTIYTPGSRAGRPLSILRSFSAPPAELLDDDEALRERISGAVSGLLGLLRIDADPLRSREHILLSTLLDRGWREGRDLDLGSLIQQVQKPPVERIGVMDLESFFPAKDRFDLAMALNNLLASPGFAVWSEGEPLDAASLLYTADGRPRVSIISIAHLNDAERMFVVTMVLNQLIAWMRTQPGSRTLRALLYMDEVFGYLPPTANPPSKTPMLTLLKQARAFGVGCVLATQNPVDLDYKGLSNAGTWFLGRLQTERDQARVMEGLEGASAAAGQGFDRPAMEALLSGLKSRRFLMNNVHEDEPVLFETRWVLSYLAGPLTRRQIGELESGGVPAPESAPAPHAMAAREAAGPLEPKRPIVPAEVAEGFLPITRLTRAAGRVVYRPALLGQATLHYAHASSKVDHWDNVALLASIDADTGLASPWPEPLCGWRVAPELEDEPEAGAVFADLPATAGRARSYPRWRKMLESHLYRARPLTLWKCKETRLVSRPGETEGAFRGRIRDQLREQRDLEVEKLRARFAPRLRRLQDQIRRAEDAAEVQREQYAERRNQTLISIGATVLGAVFGRSLSSGATTAARGASRAARERGDIARAEARVEEKVQRLEDMEREFQDAVAQLEDPVDVAALDLTAVRVAPRKSDLDAQPLRLVWTPWHVDARGIATPLFEGPASAAA